MTKKNPEKKEKEFQSSPNKNGEAENEIVDGSNKEYTPNSVERNEEFSYELRIPKDRVAVLIGKNGETKDRLEQETGTKLKIDSNEGDVYISGTDPISLFTVREVIRAIARGFNPDIAHLLLKQDYSFEIINLSEIAKNKNDLQRIKGRLIGADGKTRKIIEDLCECHMCVYGKTVGIIGLPENVGIVRKAVEMIIAGSRHSTVYQWLERKRRELKRAELIGEKIEFKE